LTKHKRTRFEREGPHIGDGLDGRSENVRPFLVESPREGGEALLFEDFPDRGWT